MPSRHPAAYIRGSTFFPVDPIHRNWDADLGDRDYYRGDGDIVKYRYIAEPIRVTTMAQVLASPDEAESYIRESLTLNLLLANLEGVPESRLQNATRSMLASRQLLQHELTKRTGVTARFGEE